jgi:hypothetical protein
MGSNFNVRNESALFRINTKIERFQLFKVYHSGKETMWMLSRIGLIYDGTYMYHVWCI